MPTFDYTFTVNAPVEAVSAFHHDTSVLKKLSPPPIFIQLHRFDPMGEGAIAQFTMWLGPIPLRWQAIHSDVSINGFTDTQQRGPLQSWQHTHRFIADGPDRTTVHEHIEYEHTSGLRGLFTRLLFAKPGLYFLFTYRRLVTQRGAKQFVPTPSVQS